MRATGLFLWGFAAELTRLMLIVATGTLAADFFGGRMGPAPAATMVALLAVFATYALLVLVPARDITQGWLGMLAGRQPAAFDEPAENIGRVFGDVVIVAGFVVVMIVTFGNVSSRGSASSEAFVAAFLLMSLLVFGLGNAVPRLWFAVRTARHATDEAPELLRVAGRRAAIFCYCAFLGVGIALSAARVVAGVRGLGPAPVHTGSALKTTGPPAPAVHQIEEGTLCASADCKANGYVSFIAKHAGRVTLAYSSEDNLPACIVSVRFYPHADDPRFAPAVEKLVAADGKPVAVDVEADQSVQFALYLDESVARCGYHIAIDEPGTEP